MIRSLTQPGTRGIALACGSALLSGVASAQWQTSPLNVANVAPFGYDFHGTANWTGGTVNGALPIGPTAAGTAWLLADPALGLPSLVSAWNSNDNRTLAIGRLGGTVLSVADPSADVSVAADTITIAGHGLQTGDRVLVNSNYSSNGGIGRACTECYVLRVDDNTFKLALTSDGANVVNITATPGTPLEFLKLTPIALNGGTVSYTKASGGGVNALRVGTTLSGAGTVNASPLTYGLTVQLTQDVTVHVQNDSASGTAEVQFNQGLTGSYGLIKTGDGLLTLGAAANGPRSLGSFTGGVTVEAGSLQVVQGPTLVGTTLVGSPLGLGALTFGDGTALAQGNANYTIANEIDTGSGQVTFSQYGDNTTTTLSGPIAGSGTLTLVNSASGTRRKIRFSGATANPLTGTIQATGQVEFELGKNTGVAAFDTGTLALRDNAILRFAAHHNLTQNVTVSLDHSAQITFDTNAYRQNVGGLLLNTANATPIVMSSGSAWLSVGAHTDLATAAGPAVHLRNGGVLGGAASLNLLLRVSAAGGRIAPGASGDGTVGALTLAGGLNATSPATFSFDLGGPAGAHDVLKLAGGAVAFTSGNVVDLSDLNASSVVPGTWTTLIDTTGASSLSDFELGNFTAGTVAATLGSPSFQIAGSGNDRQLQVGFQSVGTLILVR